MTLGPLNRFNPIDATWVTITHSANRTAAYSSTTNATSGSG